MQILRFASKEEQDYRYKKCLDCEYMSKSTIKFCKACGCLLKAKVSVSTTVCPWGKW